MHEASSLYQAALTQHRFNPDNEELAEDVVRAYKVLQAAWYDDKTRKES